MDTHTVDAPAELTEEQVQQLLNAGVHYGQRLSKRSPKMDPFVYGVSHSGLQIIDLNQTWQKLHEACDLLKKLAQEDKNILFVGTNDNAVADVLRDYAGRYQLANVTNRWLGGMLTNPVTRSRVNLLRELEGMEQSGMLESMPPKERSMVSKKLDRLRKRLGGVKDIRGAIHAIVLLDPMHEMNATLEALKKRKNLVIIAVADTDCTFSPNQFDVMIPCNVSSMSALGEVMDQLSQAIKSGRENRAPRGAGYGRRPRPGGGAGKPPQQQVQASQPQDTTKPKDTPDSGNQTS